MARRTPATISTLSTTSPSPFGGSGDARAYNLSLAERFRGHADWIVKAGRSPLSEAVMRGAAEDIEAGGIVAELFDGLELAPGSVPQLRLLAALHYLVLSGQAPALARFYPSAGGTMPAAGAWPVALATIREQTAAIEARVGRTVQTNEPRRAAVLYPALLWLAERYNRPIRLLELGASAGLNLHFDRYCYAVGGLELGDPGSPIRFEEPWSPGPEIDLARAARRLRIAGRAGCDAAPLDVTLAEDRLSLLSYIWADELHRIERMRTALELAAAGPPAPVQERSAGDWLAGALAAGGDGALAAGGDGALAADGDGELTVVWHSLFRRYVAQEEWQRLNQAFERAAEERQIAWLGMEPSAEQPGRIALTVKIDPAGPLRVLAWCDDHGPPVCWVTRSPGELGSL
jgi:hypothetical protein